LKCTQDLLTDRFGVLYVNSSVAHHLVDSVIMHCLVDAPSWGYSW